jgi:threonine/homoserine/homoserine lactone efflux protein
MTIQSWLIYLTLVFIATSTPGPAVVFIMTNSTLHGWKKAVFAALGNIMGLLFLGIIAISGLGTILKTSVIVFSVLKYAGAAYLIYMGIKMIIQKSSDLSPIDNPLGKKKITAQKMFLQAFGVAVSNPKAVVFLTALFPQFIDIQTAIIPQFAILISILMLFSFCFLMSYALLVHKARIWLKKPKRVAGLNRIFGSVFIGFGWVLATSTNK